MVSSYVTAAMMDKVLGPILFFLGGMVVGSTLVAIAWYIAHIRYYKPKQDAEQKVGEPEQRVTFVESEVEEIETEDCAAVVVDDDSQGDYLLEDKSQIVSIVDFRAVPRNESARQQARRELVIQMLIAESMSN
ncbi:hypothetical protein Ocin01_00316 [Orchesella cincta]|uniref:Uncharacterized protein n=1 Tax=Orchesella cincta TaxID=48709 RepID=A0A1D2NMA5_ORCCI|nr:hypothetical protein Ocin01_00316 [Orchesella cincta]